MPPGRRPRGQLAQARRCAQRSTVRWIGVVWALPSRTIVPPRYAGHMADPPVFDPAAMIERFRQRAQAVRERGMPPIEGPERQRWREQAQRDFSDYAMIGDAEAELVDGILTLRIDLRQKPKE